MARSTTSILKVLLIMIAGSVFAVSCLRKESEKASVPLTGAETPVPPQAPAANSAFESFSHIVPEHKQFACDTCHRREGAVEIKYAGHEACIGCHLNQFTRGEGKICSICHQETKSAPPPLQAFPTKFVEGFNMKFVHAAHIRGDGLPPQGCASCHVSSGPGKSIPAGIRAHTNCYTCHKTESNIGACNVCHELATYSRTPQSRYVFGVAFSHSDHSGTQGLSCSECHSVRSDAPQGRQVSNIIARQHKVAAGNNCYSCHNGSRAFGGNGPNDFANCKRCHTQPGFDMGLP
jgi:c(7)-type cytochrome triheme protein